MSPTTRIRILDATKQILQEQGPARLTTKAIARVAGVAEGTLFKYFERKEDLLLAVVQEHLPSFVAAVRPELVGSRPLSEQLELITQAAIDYYTQLIPLVVAVSSDATLLTRQQEWMQANQAGPQRIYELVGAYVMGEQQRGRIHPQRDPLSVAALLLGPAYQFAFMRYFTGANPLPQTEQKFVASLVQSLLAGIALDNP